MKTMSDSPSFAKPAAEDEAARKHEVDVRSAEVRCAGVGVQMLQRRIPHVDELGLSPRSEVVGHAAANGAHPVAVVGRHLGRAWHPAAHVGDVPPLDGIPERDVGRVGHRPAIGRRYEDWIRVEDPPFEAIGRYQSP